MKSLSTLYLACLLLVCALVFNCTVCLAQRNVIKFDPQHCDRFTRGFRNVTVFDQRPDTLANLGYVRLGLENRIVKVQTNERLGKEIADYYKALSESASLNSDNDLIVVVHDLVVTETGSGLSKEYAFFRYRAEYFTGQDDAYHSMGMIDTTVDISGFDVTRRLMRLPDECLCLFCQNLADNYLPAAADSVFTLKDVQQVESLRRYKMPAYQTQSYPDGIYPTWDDFLQLVHLDDKKVIGYKKKHFIGQGINKKGKVYTFGIAPINTDKPINPGRVIVFKGVPYRAFGGKFYPLVFSEDLQFHFTARSFRYNPGASGVLPVAGMGTGAVDAGVLDIGKKKEYDFTINWRTGKIMPGRLLNTPKAKKGGT